VVDDAAISIEPESDAIADALRLVLNDASLQGDLREQSLRQAARFSWRQTAELTVDAYREVLSRRGART
jgi:glycosyltransferase involved in cell wall biosynthesis